MKSLFLAILISLSFHSAQAQLTDILKDNGAEKGYGGLRVQVGGQSWKSLVKLDFWYTDGTSSLCSGVLFDYQKIVTAGHCLEKTGISTLRVSYYHGSRVIEYRNYSRSEFSKFIHYGYNSYNSDNDAGVIRFPSGLQYPYGYGHTPATVLSTDDNVFIGRGTRAYMVGVGLNEYDSTGELLYISGSYSHFSGSSTLVFNPDYGQSTCGGDSGGGLFIANSSGQLRFAGIISHNYQHRQGCQAGNPVGVTFINQNIYDWIVSY